MDITKFLDVKLFLEILSSETSLKLVIKQRNKERELKKNLQPNFHNVFAKGSKNPDYALILANCLHSLKQQVKETFDFKCY